ncbi:MAG: hypothetical protein GY679_01010 [Mycoplasma sp.]|nr:hypothetical protein [Mycoplasma sp.]
MKKTNKKIGKSNTLKRKKMGIFGNKDDSNNNEYEEIIQTTDAINLISSSPQSSADMSKQLASSAESVNRNFDLARRKISKIYEEILLTGNYVSTPFLSIQIILREYSKNWEVKYIEKVINNYIEFLFEVLSYGNSISLTKTVLIDNLYYSNKILPIAKISPSATSLIKLFTWETVFQKAVEKKQLMISDRIIIATFIEAIEANINIGYYIKLGDIIISRIEPSKPELVLLFSNYWLQELNHKYKKNGSKNYKERVTKNNIVESFDKNKNDLKEQQQYANIETSIETPEAKMSKDDDNTLGFKNSASEISLTKKKKSSIFKKNR